MIRYTGRVKGSVSISATYISFAMPVDKAVDVKESFSANIITRFISLFLPKANPDFSSRIDDVAQWLLEFVEDLPTPNREIGLDVNGKVILKMPFRKNYGYWTDNNLTLSEFRERFKVADISQENFEMLWNSLD